LSSRRSPKPAGPSWPPRHCKTSAATSASTSLLGRPAAQRRCGCPVPADTR
jgi:hypothetical protein